MPNTAATRKHSMLIGFVLGSVITVTMSFIAFYIGYAVGWRNGYDGKNAVDGPSIDGVRTFFVQIPHKVGAQMPDWSFKTIVAILLIAIGLWLIVKKYDTITEDKRKRDLGVMLIVAAVIVWLLPLIWAIVVLIVGALIVWRKTNLMRTPRVNRPSVTTTTNP